MNIILWIVFGGVAGWLASLMMNGGGMGIIGNVVVGIIGAFIGGWLADQFGVGGKPGVERPTNFLSFITAVIGAVVLLFLANLIL